MKVWCRWGGGGEDGKDLVELVAGAVVQEESQKGQGGGRIRGGLMDAVNPGLVKHLLRLESETIVAIMRMKEMD